MDIGINPAMIKMDVATVIFFLLNACNKGVLSKKLTIKSLKKRAPTPAIIAKGAINSIICRKPPYILDKENVTLRTVKKKKEIQRTVTNFLSLNFIKLTKDPKRNNSIENGGRV